MASAEHRVLIETYGFKCRQSLDGKRCNYRTPPPRSRWLDRKQSVVLYLKAEHAQGRMLDLKAEMFCFGKRKAEGDQTGRESTSVGMGTTELVTKDPGVVLDHRHILSTTAKRLDSFITGRGQPASSECVEGAKERVAGAVDDKSLLSALMSDSKLVDCLAGEILELHVSEIAGIRGGPLTQFPPDVNRNLYADIVEWAMQEIPGSLAHVAGLATRRDRPVLPRDVVVIASALANSAYLVNHHISAVIQLRSWTSQAEGLHDSGLDRLSACSLVSPARTLNQQKDVLTEQGAQLLVTAGSRNGSAMPRQYILDNVDINGEHLMLKVSVLENEDTSHLGVTGLSKEESVRLIKKELVNMSSPARDEQRHHLLDMLYHHWGAEVGGYGGERTARLKKLLSGKHRHTYSEETLKSSTTFIEKLYPCQETSHSAKCVQVLRFRQHILTSSKILNFARIFAK